MLKIFQRLWQVNWAEQWQYRANLLMYLLYWLVAPILYLSIWTSIAKVKGSVNGFTPNDFVTYYMVLLLCDQITSNILIHVFAYKVQDGSLSPELTRPIHPIMTNALVSNIAFKVLTIMGLIPVWIVLFFLFRPDFSGVLITNVLLALPLMIIAFLTSYILSASVTSVAFWTTRVNTVHDFYMAIVLLFSGQFVPLTLTPVVIQNIARFLPFPLTLFYPIQLILGKLTTAEIIQSYAVGSIWLLISIVLFNWVWRNGIKRYSAVGA